MSSGLSAKLPESRLEDAGTSSELSASQLALESLVRRNRSSWIFVPIFNITCLALDPRTHGRLAWYLFTALNVCVTLLRIWLVYRMGQPNGITTGRVRLLMTAIPLHFFCAALMLSDAYLRWGFDPLVMLATMAISIYAYGALALHRYSLQLIRWATIAFLLPPGLTALWIGGNVGTGMAILLLAELIYCQLRAKVENFEFWDALHTNRDLKIAQRQAQEGARVQAELVANRARQTILSAERSRIAGEWHDTLLAGLSAIGWQIDAAQSKLAEHPEESIESLALARTILQHYRAEARLVIADLQSGAFEAEDLQTAITEALEPLRHGHAARVEVGVGAGASLLASPKRQQLIRICQEAVTNALRHGAPGLVRVTVRVDGEATWLEVVDDGRGFDVAAKRPGHFGLQIMKERAARVSGTLKVSSEQGGGTKVVLRIPNITPADLSKTRLMIVEDQYFSRLALHSVFDAHADWRIVAEAGTGAEGIRLYREHRPDVTIMDLRLPDTSGFEVIKAICPEDPTARIVVLSNLGGTEHIQKGTAAGAAAYLTKDASSEELIRAVEAVLRGDSYLPAALAERLGSRSAGDALTPRERDVVEQMVQGFTDRDIATRLGISEKAVRALVESLIAKLHATDRAHVAELAVQAGVVEPPV